MEILIIIGICLLLAYIIIKSDENDDNDGWA